MITKTMQRNILDPNDGDVISKFGRSYMFRNPNASQGPGVWRLSTIDEIASSGGGSIGSISVVTGTDPIVSVTEAAGEVDISIDIDKLEERA